MEKTIKKQKTIITILSIIIIALTLTIIGTQIAKSIEENTYSVEFTKRYTNPPSLYPYYTIEITCKKNVTINVEDFSFVMDDENNMLLNSLTYNDKEYTQDESFVVYPYKSNIITIHRTAGYPQETDLCFKMTPIKLYETKNFR